MWKPGSKSKSSSSVKVDFLDLCKERVRSIEDLVRGGNLLNQRQCQDLSTKLSKTHQNIRELVLQCGTSAALFQPALENLYLYLEKAKLLVQNCGEKDWWVAAVFQIQNKNAFQEILLEVALCYNAIYEQAKSASGDGDVQPEDLRQTAVFGPASDSYVHEDQQDLLRKLNDLANEPRSAKLLGHILPDPVALKQCLAKYLLVKFNFTADQSQVRTLDTGSEILWRKESEPSGTWGMFSRFLGAGGGASGVCKTKWLGVPCAKKEFHPQEAENVFLKEAGILAYLKHPRIVTFFCCGNGQETGDRFIAMELMEKSLFKLIEEQKVYFSLPVVVDMMVQMARGMCYLHRRGVAHRDLKPQNVVVNKLKSPDDVVDHFSLKLVDFGLSKTKVEVSKFITMTALGIGTTRYRAPEVHRNSHPGGVGKINWLQADVFSYAMTCAHLVSLKAPFGEMQNLSGLYEVVKKGRRPELPSDCPKELVAILRDCWNSNPRSRPSFIEVCSRLERFQHKVLRGFFTPDLGLEVDKTDFSAGFDFITVKLDEQSVVERLLVDDNDHDPQGEFYRNEVASIIPCTCGRPLEYLPQVPLQPPYSGSFRCNMCGERGDWEVYHCGNCRFDAHRDCAEIKDEVEVFFHDHPLHLLVQNHYNCNPDVICRFCEESLQHSEWVYRCEQCEFDVHALCTKYPREWTWKRVHPHPISLIQCPPHKRLSCTCCNGEVRRNTWRYTCTQKWCAFGLHPSCIIRSWDPLCIFDSSHSLYLHKSQRTFNCGKCGALGLSWRYHCKQCNVDIHLDCMDDMEEEEEYWIRGYKNFMLEYGSKDDHFKMDMVSKLLDRFFMIKSLDANSSSFMSPQVTMSVQQSIQRLTLSEEDGLDAFDDVNVRKRIDAETLERKAKKRTAKEARQKLKANSLEMLENLERIVLDMESSMNMSQADAEVLVATHEKLKKGRYIAQEEIAKQVQSKIRQGPRICVFFMRKKGGSILELLTSLRADMKDVRFKLLCEEPGHEHIVRGSKVTLCNGVLGEERVGKLQPLLSSGLQVVTRAMGTLVGQQPQLDCMTLPNLGEFEWDLRAMDLERHGERSREPFEEEENVELLKRAEDSAAEWMLSTLENRVINIYKGCGLLRVRYLVTEEGNCPRYTRGTLAWLCADHFKDGLEAGRLEPYPVQYYNEQR